MKKIVLLCFALAGGLQAMEVNLVDLESGEGGGEPELVWLNEEDISATDYHGYKTIVITVDNSSQAAYLHLAQKYGEKAIDHAGRNLCWCLPRKQLDKAARQIERLKQLFSHESFKEQKNCHFESYFEKYQFEANPGRMAYELTFEQSVSEEKVQAFLASNPDTKDMRVDGAYFPRIETAAKIYAAKKFERKWQWGYKVGLAAGFFAGVVMTWATNVMIDNWES